MTSVDLDICETQGLIYKEIASKKYDVEEFSKRYLTSKFCRRSMDTIYSRFQVASELECLDFIYPEIQMEPREEISEDPYVAYWIGFTYRYLYIEYEIPSAELNAKIPYKTMLKRYPGLSTIDERDCAEILFEDYLK